MSKGKEIGIPYNYLGGRMKSKENKKKILELLNKIDELAADSRGYYENARGNDGACYEATRQIRTILEGGNEK